MFSISWNPTELMALSSKLSCIIVISLCVCAVCVWGVCGCLYTCMWPCLWRPNWHQVSFSVAFYTFLRQVYLTELGICWFSLTNWLVSSRDLHSTNPQGWSCPCTSLHMAFSRMLRILPQVSTLIHQTLYWSNHLPSLENLKSPYYRAFKICLFRFCCVFQCI